MSYIDDLAEWPLAGKTIDTLRAVGWLERGRAFTQGEVSDRFFEALMQLLVDPWQPFANAGRHACSLCRFVGGPAEISYEGTTVALGASNLFVPGDGVIYVAPSLVAHYVDAHEYQPPEQFMKAVLECPQMRSMQYLRAIKSIGGSALIAGIKAR